MGRPGDREMPPIEGGDRGGAKPLARGDDRCVDGAERQVAVGSHQLGDPEPVGRNYLFGHQRARRQVAEKTHFGLGPDSAPEQIRDLGHYQDRYQDGSWVALDQAPTTAMLGIVSVVCRIERSGVGDQRPASSDLKISSIRWETSLRPLRPAAPSLRLPPPTR